MTDFLLSSFSLMGLIVILTACVFLISLYQIPHESGYKKWLKLYFLGLLLWHGMGFLSGGIHTELREITYRFSNTLFNLGLCVTSFAFVQIAYLFPNSKFENERRITSRVFLVLCIGFMAAILWFHFLKNQEGMNSHTYGSFVNLLAGIFGFIITSWALLVFLRRGINPNRSDSKDIVPSRLLGISTLFTLLISALFIYPGISQPFVLPTYIYGLWLIIQAQIIIFIVYSAFPISIQSKLVGFTFSGVMAILSVATMVLVAFTTNSDDPDNLAQRLADQPILIKLMLIIVGATFFVLWIYPIILKTSVISPLKRLLNGIQKAEEGKLSVSVPYDLLDEIGLVTKNFNEMVYSLKLSDEKLRNYAQTLEDKVKERTSELSLSLENLKSAQAQLIQAEKMASLGELTAGIAHEIQNPLNFVNNFSEVSAELVEEIQDIRRKTQDRNPESEEDEILEDIKQNLEKINHHGKRADAIVKGMLEHSRINKGEKAPTDLNALAEEFVRLSYHGLRAKDKSFNADFQLDLDPDLPKVNVVTSDIGRVILNLVNNAFYAVNEKAKSTPQPSRNIGTSSEGGEGYQPRIIVKTTKTKSPSEPVPNSHGDLGVEISVSDNGSGIPDSIKEKIFQPFFTTKPTGQGTGLGLSLSYDIVKAHGGEIIIDSKINKGTNFSIKLPLF
jgi:signal transduction histidine kinase